MTQALRATGGSWRNTIWGELAAEFLGTAVLIAFGDGVVAMAVAALNQSGRGTAIFQASGDWLLITWGWAMAVTLGVYVAGGVSGAHINPAVTIALAVRRGFPWRKVIPYSVAQIFGAFVGAAIVYLVYHNAIGSYEAAHGIVRGQLGGPADSTATYSIFATFPAPYFGANMFWPLVDQVVGTMFLMMLILALTDKANQPPMSNMTPFIVGLVVAAIGMSYGANAGYAINPARDFGPRIWALFAGWGAVAMPGVHGYFWIPIVGPIIGAIIGAVVYDLLIHDVLLARAEPAADVTSKGRTVTDTRPGERVESRGETNVERTELPGRTAADTPRKVEYDEQGRPIRERPKS
jgi:glycerol uptake facilitator